MPPGRCRCKVAKRGRLRSSGSAGSGRGSENGRASPARLSQRHQMNPWIARPRGDPDRGGEPTRLVPLARTRRFAGHFHRFVGVDQQVKVGAATLEKAAEQQRQLRLPTLSSRMTVPLFRRRGVRRETVAPRRAQIDAAPRLTGRATTPASRRCAFPAPPCCRAWATPKDALTQKRRQVRAKGDYFCYFRCDVRGSSCHLHFL